MKKAEIRKIITVTPEHHTMIKKRAASNGTFVISETDKVIEAGLKALEPRKKP